MAHETGSATNPLDLQDKLRAFCLAQGATIHAFEDEGSSPGKKLIVELEGNFFTIYVDEAGGSVFTEGFSLSQHTAYAPSTALGSQENETGIGVCRTNVLLSSAIPIYHFAFFAGGVVMVSFTNSLGVWRNFCFGQIEKYGTWVGGAIIAGTHVNQGPEVDNPSDAAHSWFCMWTTSAGRSYAIIRVDNAALEVKMRLNFSGGAIDERIASNFAVGTQELSSVWATSPSTPTQASSLTPINFNVLIEGSSTKWAPIGVLRDVRFCNMQFLDNEQVFDTDWIAISQGVKKDINIRDEGENAGFMGVAVRVS